MSRIHCSGANNTKNIISLEGSRFFVANKYIGNKRRIRSKRRICNKTRIYNKKHIYSSYRLPSNINKVVLSDAQNNSPLEFLSHSQSIVFQRSNCNGNSILHVAEVIRRDSQSPKCQTASANN